MAITNGYASLSEVKAALRITDTVDDAALEIAIESTSRMIDDYAARLFYSAGTASKVYAPMDRLKLAIHDAQTITLVESASGADLTYDTTWAATDWQAEPLNRIAPQPITRLVAIGDYAFPVSRAASVRVTGTWGWSAVPVQVKQATIIQATRLFKRADSPLGVAGFGDLGVMRVARGLDPDVAELLQPFRRMW